MYRIIFIMACLLASCSNQSKETAAAQPPVPVIVADTIVQDVPLYIEALGMLKANAILEVRPQVSGTLTEILCKEGQEVKKGTPLFKVDPISATLKVREIEAQLAQSQASFDSVSKKLERFNNLSVKDLISRQEWDEIEAQVVISKARLDGDTAKLQSAKRELENCTVRAPINGRIGKLNCHTGNHVSGSNALTTLTQLSPLVADFRLTERECNLLFANEDKNCPIEICSLHKPETQASGKITFIDHYFEERTGLLTVFGKIDNSQHKFLPGQPVNVKIPFKTMVQAKLVPSKSIKINQNGHYVFAIGEDSTAAIRTVKLGEEVGDNVIILEGIQPGETVVTVGHLRLFPGAKVEITAKEGLLP